MPFKTVDGVWVDSYGVPLKKALRKIGNFGKLDPDLDGLCRKEEAKTFGIVDSREMSWAKMLSAPGFRFNRRKYGKESEE